MRTFFPHLLLTVPIGPSLLTHKFESLIRAVLELGFMFNYLWKISVLFGCECRQVNVETAMNTELLANPLLEMEHQSQALRLALSN
jgi:hypothetical protein